MIVIFVFVIAGVCYDVVCFVCVRLRLLFGMAVEFEFECVCAFDVVWLVCVVCLLFVLLLCCYGLLCDVVCVVCVVVALFCYVSVCVVVVVVFLFMFCVRVCFLFVISFFSFCVPVSVSLSVSGFVSLSFVVCVLLVLCCGLGWVGLDWMGLWCVGLVCVACSVVCCLLCCGFVLCVFIVDVMCLWIAVYVECFGFAVPSHVLFICLV